MLVVRNAHNTLRTQLVLAVALLVPALSVHDTSLCQYAMLKIWYTYCYQNAYCQKTYQQL